MSEAYVKSHIEHGINTIEFFHPQSNSLPGKILEELAREIHFAGTHDDTRVIILKSGGDKTFCSGASFDELASIKNEKEGLKFFSGFANVINAMRKCPRFIIGRVQGKCVGGGVGLASAVDYAIAKTSIIQKAWKNTKGPDLHGWVYDLRDGIINPVFDMPVGSKIDDIFEYNNL